MTDFSDNRFGAQKNPMLLIGLPEKPIPSTTPAPPWGLTGKQAVNFTNADRVVLTAGTVLYRVYGGAANETGAYWALNAPAKGTTEGAWRSKNAVLPWWNDGTMVASLKVTSDIHVWKGGIESQHARYANGEIMPEYWLVGGGEQLLVQFWRPEVKSAIQVSKVGPTPWANQTKILRAPASVAPAEGASALDATDPQQGHIHALFALGEALRSASVETGDAQDLAANNVVTDANAMLAALGTDDQKLHALTATSLGLGRLIDVDPDNPCADAIETSLTNVVSRAAQLTGRAG